MKNKGLQFSRGIAMLCILFAHSFAYAEVNYTELTVASSLDFWGRYGLLQFPLFFFLISGYLIAMQVKNGTYSNPLLFLKKRATSIYPTYWMVALICLMPRILVKRLDAFETGLWKALLLIPGNHPFVCMDEWTLVYEVMFYLNICIFMWGIGNGIMRKIFPYFSVVALITLIAINVHGIQLVTLDMKNLFISMQYSYFFAGIVLFYITEKLRLGEILSKLPNVARYVGLLLSVFAFVAIITELGQTPYYWIILYPVVVLICLFSLVLNVGQKNIFVLLGNNSYVMYLVHPTLYNYLYRITAARLGEWNPAVHF
ncbi:MAG: acyltransferase, partial [Lachnospiraceae bacterium]|nr:acyltransferase [Candidatus Colinaster scatohippi]